VPTTHLMDEASVWAARRLTRRPDPMHPGRPEVLVPGLRKKAGSRVVPRGRAVRARNGGRKAPVRGTHPDFAALS